MIHSLFVLNQSGEAFFEKHWRAKIPRSVVDDFWAYHVAKESSLSNLAPVIAHGKYFFIFEIKDDIILLGVVTNDVPPLMTLQVLERIAAIWRIYFEKALSESTLKSNFVIAYQVLEEMIDYGFPMITEPSVLKDLVPPPSIASKLRGIAEHVNKEKASSTVVGKQALGLGARISSDVMWRRRHVSYHSDELFVELNEEVDAIYRSDGTLVEAMVFGRVDCNSRLSGMPNVLITFTDSSMLDDTSVHPCVKFQRFARDGALNFIPPDGKFLTMSYRAPLKNGLPFYVRPTLSQPGSGDGRIGIMVGMKSGDKAAKAVEEVEITLTLPPSVASPAVDCNEGRTSVDAKRAKLRWDIGKITPGKSPCLNVNMRMPAGFEPVLQVFFKLPGVSLTGLNVESIAVTGEKYKPYKGVRTASKSGRFFVRTG